MVNLIIADALINKLLELPEFEVYDFKQNENDVAFYVQFKKVPDFCENFQSLNQLAIQKTVYGTLFDAIVEAAKRDAYR